MACVMVNAQSLVDNSIQLHKTELQIDHGAHVIILAKPADPALKLPDSLSRGLLIFFSRVNKFCLGRRTGFLQIRLEPFATLLYMQLRILGSWSNH